MLSTTLPALGLAADDISKISWRGSGWSPLHRPKATRSAVSPALPPMFFRYQSRACEISGTARWIESNGGASYCAYAGAQKHHPTAITSHGGTKTRRKHILVP